MPHLHLSLKELKIHVYVHVHARKAWNAWKHATLKRFELLDTGVERHFCPGHNVHFTIHYNFLEGKVMAILPFKEGYFWIILARHSCVSLTHLCCCVSDFACFRLCKQPPPNSTSDWLAVKCYSTSANRHH